jgi:phage terminase large subunit GpA-like protein
MNIFGRKEIEEVCVCGAPQTGKTLAMYACLGYSIERRQGTKMLAMPDDKTLARVEHEKLRPLLVSSSSLNSLILKMVKAQVRLKGGSSLFLSSAQSPSQRASITVRDLFLDEEDLYGKIAGKGDPVSDFLERTRSYFFDRKIMRVSKPVGDSNSSIWRAVTLGVDQTMSYEVPCPYCGEWQFFDESSVVALKLKSKEEPDPNEILRLKLGRYQCCKCKNLWTDGQRDSAVGKGRWQPSSVKDSTDNGTYIFYKVPKVEKPLKIGFHLPAILSKAVSISELAAKAKMAAASEDPEVKQTQANGDWARPYVAVVTKPDAIEILKRRDFNLPARTVPYGAVALTCGIDTQKYGFYYLVTAWMPDMTKYIIDYGQLRSFDDVYRLVYETTYPVMDSEGKLSGEVMEIWRAGIDSGGTVGEGEYSRTVEVYEFCRLNGYDRLFPIKGASRDITPAIRYSLLDKMPGGQVILGGLVLYLIDTGKMKSVIFPALQDEMASRPIKLYGTDPALDDQTDLHKELIDQLTAERQIRTANGQTKWVQERKDNHYLDCLVIARACGDVSWIPSLHHYVLELEAEKAAEQAAEANRHKAHKKSSKERRSMW